MLQKIKKYYLACPASTDSLNGFVMDGFDYKWPYATCKDCNKKWNIFDLFNNSLIQECNYDAPVSFKILDSFDIINYHRDLLIINHKPLQQIEIDFTKLGLPKTAEIIFLNITPNGGNGSHLINLWQSKMFEEDIPKKMIMISTVPELKTLPIYYDKKGSINIDQETIICTGGKSIIDTDTINKACFVLDWFDKTNVSIIENHIISTAKDYFKLEKLLRESEPYSDSEFEIIKASMIYNSFSAFEIKLSNILDKFWEKQGIKDTRNFLVNNTDSKIEKQLTYVCRKFGLIEDLDQKQKFNLIKKWKAQRNSIVHHGRLNREEGYKITKEEVYSIFCWSILLLKEIELKII